MFCRSLRIRLSRFVDVWLARQRSLPTKMQEYCFMIKTHGLQNSHESHVAYVSMVTVSQTWRVIESLRQSGKQCMKIFGLCCGKCDLSKQAQSSSKSEKRWVKPKQFNCDRRSYPALGLKNHGELIR